MNDQNLDTPQSTEETLDQIRLQVALQDRLLACLCRSLARNPEIVEILEIETLAELDDIAQTHPEVADLAEAYSAKLLSPRNLE